MYPFAKQIIFKSGEGKKADIVNEDEFDFGDQDRSILEKERTLTTFSFDSIRVAHYAPSIILTQGVLEGQLRLFPLLCKAHSLV